MSSDDSPDSEQPDPSLWRRLRSRRWVRWTMDIAIVVALVAAISAYQSRHLLEDDQPVPPFELQELEGSSTLETDELEAERTIVYFWATWCGVCDAQAGVVSWFHDRADDDPDLDVVSIALHYGDRAEVRSYVEDHDIDFPVYLGTDAVARGFEVDSFPTIYIVDGNGQIRHGTVGYTTRAGLWTRLRL